MTRPWEFAFAEALRETDPRKLEPLCEKARRAIHERVLELGAPASAPEAHQKERQALEEALRNLSPPVKMPQATGQSVIEQSVIEQFVIGQSVIERPVPPPGSNARSLKLPTPSAISIAASTAAPASASSAGSAPGCKPAGTARRRDHKTAERYPDSSAPDFDGAV